MFNPKNSCNCPMKMMTAIPAVNPATTGYGMNLISTPSRNTPITTNITPAITVASANPPYPYPATIPASNGTNAPVGPPICTRLPPSAEIRNPAMIAVHNPCAGVTPDAIPNPIANGNATTPTVIPAARSAANVARS